MMRACEIKDTLHDDLTLPMTSRPEQIICVDLGILYLFLAGRLTTQL